MEILGNVLIPILALAVIILLILFISKSRKDGRHYDEMQEHIRATGYKISYFVTLIGLTLLCILMETIPAFSRVISPTFGMFTVLMAGIVTFVIYCIFHDSFLSIGQNIKSYMVLCIVIIVCNGIGCARQISEKSFLEDGQLTFSGASNLVCALSFLVILIALVIRNAKSGETEE